MNRIIFLFVLSLFFFSCQNDSNNSKSQNTPTTQAHPNAPAAKDIELAQKKSKVSASTKQNLSTGYWHIGGAVNVDTDSGKEAYVGKWLKFNPDMTYIYGKDDKEVNRGTWWFNEEGEYLTLVNKKSNEFFLKEWQARQAGDVTLLLGNTPYNASGGQIKLVRQDKKLIDFNPN